MLGSNDCNHIHNSQQTSICLDLPSSPQFFLVDTWFLSHLRDIISPACPWVCPGASSQWDMPSTPYPRGILVRWPQQQLRSSDSPPNPSSPPSLCSAFSHPFKEAYFSFFLCVCVLCKLQHDINPDTRPTTAMLGHEGWLPGSRFTTGVSEQMEAQALCRPLSVFGMPKSHSYQFFDYRSSDLPSVYTAQRSWVKTCHPGEAFLSGKAKLNRGVWIVVGLHVLAL